MEQLTLTALPDIDEIVPNDDIGMVACRALTAANIEPQAGDILAIAQKIVSKAEKRFVSLSTIEPSDRAIEVADQTNKDPRLVELILQQATEISRMRKGVLITRHKLGFVSANSAIDRSNVPQNDAADRVLLLPENPDRSAKQIRNTILQTTGVEIGVVITDTHGRPHRLGAIGVAIGIAGLQAVADRRGEYDRYGYELKASQLAVADEIAAAASLLMGAAAESNPIIHIRGLKLTGSGQASDLYRPPHLDLYR